MVQSNKVFLSASVRLAAKPADLKKFRLPAMLAKDCFTFSLELKCFEAT